VMRSFAMAVGCLALAMTGLARAATGLRVPAVVGMSESRAQCTLAAAGLRWRYRGDNRVYARPIIACGGRAVVLPDPVVISESAPAGTRVAGGSVIVLDDACLRLARQHRGACM
jgi:beta-lactam-binding protein with PASTA domain